MRDVPSGVLKSHQASADIRFAAIAETEIAQFAKPVKAFGKKKGETITITRIKNIPVPTSAALSEQEDIPIDPFSIGTSSATVLEYGRGVEYSSLAEDLSYFDLENAVQKQLRKQLQLVLDIAAATALKTAYVIAIPTSQAAITWDTDGTASTAAVNNFNFIHCGIVRDYMRDTLIVPWYEGKRYMGIGSTKLLRGIKSDPDFQFWRQYLNPGDVLYESEVGDAENIRWIESNNTAALANNKGTGSVLGEGIVFGDDALALAEVETPELRAAIPGRFGTLKAVAWYGVYVYFLPWSATATAGEAKVVRIGSST